MIVTFRENFDESSLSFRTRDPEARGADFLVCQLVQTPMRSDWWGGHRPSYPLAGGGLSCLPACADSNAGRQECLPSALIRCAFAAFQILVFKVVSMAARKIPRVKQADENNAK